MTDAKQCVYCAKAGECLDIQAYCPFCGDENTAYCLPHGCPTLDMIAEYIQARDG